MQALLSVITAALTQLGIPAVFVAAWWWERRAHQETLKSYARDLRRAAGLVRPEDVLMSEMPAASGGGD
jgi:site-specific recombinase XerD